MRIDQHEGQQAYDLHAVDRLLTCTRAARRLLDLSRSVEPSVIEECLEIAVHAPSASNRQGWVWVVVSDASLRSQIAKLYQASFALYGTHAGGKAGVSWTRADEASAEKKDLASAAYLAEHLGEVPILVVPCHRGRPPRARPGSQDVDVEQRRWRIIESTASAGTVAASDVTATPAPGSLALARQMTFFGSIFPAVWSFQLALRSRGLGSVLTTMHLPFERQVGKLLGIPTSVTQVGLLPVAYLRHDVGPAPRRPARETTRWNSW